MNIMITGYVTIQNSVEALNIGANGFIMKPMDFEKLDEMIKECLTRQKEAVKITRGTLSKKLANNLRMIKQEGFAN